MPRQRQFNADLAVINECLNELIETVGGDRWVVGGGHSLSSGSLRWPARPGFAASTPLQLPSTESFAALSCRRRVPYKGAGQRSSLA